MNTEDIENLVAIDKRRKELKAELELISSTRIEIERRLIQEFTDASIQSMKSRDGVTIALRSDRRCSINKLEGETTDAGHDRLAGVLCLDSYAPDLVKTRIHLGSLTAWIKELIADQGGDTRLPEDLAAVVKVTDIISVRTTGH